MKPKTEYQMSFGELIRQLYRGSSFTFSELRAAKELHKRGYKSALDIASTHQRRLTRTAAQYVLKMLVF